MSLQKYKYLYVSHAVVLRVLNVVVLFSLSEKNIVNIYSMMPLKKAKITMLKKLLNLGIFMEKGME